ncbi:MULTISPECIES: PTS sugar transporter subunit IIA [Cryobacterium]|uniref:Ascorbate-specific PTS system EIIA component n=1 Tax=Cryobacterium zongtaii TaxID=1259217 RepID=A0A2S3ZAL0_9MICO|nr:MULTISPECIES: PTS sugar transporter subunit IIA [Cryobacterium]POH62589.1 PTS ascorbate transporter subunit IIA [Cryobacterium zongtaii]POH69959.1 PTS ascorbate transporter subunit IIA [Cryobacterium zongtaii]TFC42970.1 PTS sugar transporter subunit IIA [Cryobacterium sp. TMN-39-2]
MAFNLAEALSSIQTQADASDWRDAIRLAGAGLVSGGATTAAYTDEMIDAVEKHGPYIVIAPGIALAHSRPSPAVLTGGLSWVSLATPVEFGNKANDPVTVVIGLAAVDHDAHLQVMRALAGVLSDGPAMERLRTATSSDEVRAVLGELAAAAA